MAMVEFYLTMSIREGKIADDCINLIAHYFFLEIYFQPSKESFMATTKSKRDDTSQCEKCLPAYCCNYFAFGIDVPEDRRDYESLLWQIAHENVSFYIYRKDWYIMIHSRCNFLMPDNKCAIYEHRPYMCREHSTESCEYTGDDYGFTEHFKSYDELLTYIKTNTNFRFKQELTGIPPNCL
jgi:Fe-S-cluster containining protein